MSQEIPLTNIGLHTKIGPFLPIEESPGTLRQLHWQLGLEEVSSHTEIPLERLEEMVINKAHESRYRLAEYSLAFYRKRAHRKPQDVLQLLIRRFPTP